MKSTTALFKKAATAGSELANSFLKLATDKEKEAKLTELCKAPDQIYTEEM